MAAIAAIWGLSPSGPGRLWGYADSVDRRQCSSCSGLGLFLPREATFSYVHLGRSWKALSSWKASSQRGPGMACTIARMSGTATGVVTARLSRDWPMIVERSGGVTH